MPEHDLAGGQGPRPQRPTPVPRGVGGIEGGHDGTDLGGDLLHHRVEEGLLAGDVVVERHRLDAELLADPPHRDRRDALRVGHVDRSTHDALAAERGARGALRGVAGDGVGHGASVRMRGRHEC